MTAGRVPLEGVLLDIDGTLLDSNDQHARAWVDVFPEFGFEIPFERVRPLIGKGGDKLVPELTGVSPDDPRYERMTSRRAEVFKRSHLPTVRPTPGAHALIRHLHDAGLRLVVATSAQEDELEALLEQGGLTALLHRRTTSDDADASKPDPDIVHAALQRGRLDPAGVVMLGDTPYDVEAARRAGVGTVALRCGGWWDDDALRGALAIYDDPDTLLREIAASPLASGMSIGNGGL